MTPEENIVAVYNRLIQLVVGIAPRSYALLSNRQIAKTATALVKYLEEQHALPGPYLVGCFAKLSWTRQPKFVQLLSRGNQEYFRECRADAHRWWEAVAVADRAKQLPSLNPGKEIVKKRILNDAGPSFCRARAVLTGGYQSESVVCQRCSSRDRCASGV